MILISMSIKNSIGELFGLFKTLTVAKVDVIGPRFRQLRLVGSPLKGASFTPGDKLQLVLDGSMRTYSPYAYDSDEGALSILVYLHGNSPGATFGRNAREGDQVRIFGPRDSLDFRGLTASVFFGDETSLGVARALHDADRDATFFFEVGYDDNAHAIDALGLPANNVYAIANQRRLIDIASAMQLNSDTTLVLTGQARSIQGMRHVLRDKGVRYKRQRTKAYWAPGKRGLD
jgi:NADPH-dependent ferric siderophore reductase